MYCCTLAGHDSLCSLLRELEPQIPEKKRLRPEQLRPEQLRPEQLRPEQLRPEQLRRQLLPHCADQ
ncbi:MAG: hypothetical protein D3910_29235 [Candidatus Electrothrix sp. ATG2]|nr:hypothetical protein [Candidatus Electrothrix sp. ATG2]